MLRHFNTMTLVLPFVLFLRWTVLKARYRKDIILILRQRSLSKTKLTAIVLVVGSHCQHQPHVLLKELLQAKPFVGYCMNDMSLWWLHTLDACEMLNATWKLAERNAVIGTCYLSSKSSQSALPITKQLQLPDSSPVSVLYSC